MVKANASRNPRWAAPGRSPPKARAGLPLRPLLRAGRGTLDRPGAARRVHPPAPRRLVQDPRALRAQSEPVPHGLEGMKTMVRKIHAAGLKAGNAHAYRLHPAQRFLGHARARQTLGGRRLLHPGRPAGRKVGYDPHGREAASARRDLELCRPGQRPAHRREIIQYAAISSAPPLRVPQVHARRFQNQARRASQRRRGRPSAPDLHRLLSRRALDARGRSGRRDCPRVQRLRVRPDLHGRFRRHGQPARHPDHGATRSSSASSGP